MPTICTFYGILIRMFYNDHAPPHFHVEYAGDKAVVTISTLEIMEGSLPRRAQALVLEWAAAHRAELMEDWDLCRNHSAPNPIQPLD